MADSVNVRYKDTVFRLLFSDKARLLSLYNALNKTNYTDPDELEVVTLSQAIYMEVKNDIAFLIADSLHLYEHQSTRNPNMPLRFLQYITSEYQRIIDANKRRLYAKKLIELPFPEFVVFYNGKEEAPDHEELRLSTAYKRPKNAKGKPIKLDLVVDVYNINAGFNKEIQETCKALEGYSEFVRRARENRKSMTLDQAVNKAVNECIRDGILADFLRANKSEVIGVSIFEFDRDEYDDMVREESEARGLAKGKKEGKEEGRIEGIFKTLYELVRDNLLSLANAAKKAGQSEEEFTAGMSAYFAQGGAN